MLDSMKPCYQSRLGNKFCYKLTFNNYDQVIVLGKPDAKYEISDISSEYEIVIHPYLASHSSGEYQNMVLLYDRVLRHRQIPVNKSDTTWNWSFNTPCKSLKGILVLFKAEKSYDRDTSKFYNPEIQKSQTFSKARPISYMLRECNCLSYMMKFASISLKGNKRTATPMKFK